MQTRTYAERVLFGTRLADKLVDPGKVIDDQPGRPIVRPDAPGRPTGLGFLEAEGRARTRFPKLDAAADDAVRGRVLHFFANHEMLALELMALMLLRFPDAPAGFRRGLVQTMRDEQKHLGLYLARMAELGVEFGEVGVNSFFWRCLADVETPAQFAARMSLTFEQANLDFTAHYIEVFKTIGDARTVEILDVVLADEVRHVKHGLVWFDRWKEPEKSLWDAWVAQLDFPLTPARAKAFSFSRELRAKAGLPQAFVDRLEVYSHSKGKRPTLFWFNPDCESQIAHGERGKTPRKAVADRIADLETLPMLLAGPDDVVLVRTKPRASYLAQLQRAGLNLPEFVTETDALAGRTLDGLRPWGWSPDAVDRLGPLLGQVREGQRRSATDLYGPRLRALFEKTGWVDTLAEFLGQCRDRDWLCDDVDVGQVCTDLDAAIAFSRSLHAQGCRGVAVKAPIGTAGAQMIRLYSGHVEPKQASWMRRVLSRQGSLLVEPWRQRVADLSMQLEVKPDGSFVTKGLGRFLTDDRGRYIGAVVGRMTAGLAGDVARFFNDDGRDTARIERLMTRLCEPVARRCHQAGYSGPAGIDAMIYRLPDGSLRLKPLLEVNPRTTMGQLAMALRRLVPKGRAAVWRLFGRRDVEAAGSSDFVAFYDAIRDRTWAMATNDPVTARASLSVLMAAQRWEDIPHTLPGRALRSE